MYSDDDARVEELLARYDALIPSEQQRRTARLALARSLRGAAPGEPETLAKNIFLSSVFDHFCAPVLASEEERLLDLRFLLFFFEADEAASEQLEDLVAASGGDSAHPPGALGRAREDLVTALSGLGREAGDFRRAVTEMCAAMLAERKVERSTMTEEEFRRIRKHTIAVPAHSEWWRAIRGISFTKPLRETLHRSGILDSACELIYLVNDIGSLERDQQAARLDPETADLNYVLWHARTSGDLDTSVRDVIALHNTRLDEFREIEARLRGSAHGANPALGAYVDILRGMVRGNLVATRYLAPLRYPGATERLSRLHELPD